MLKYSASCVLQGICLYYYSYTAPIVSGLQNKSDNMSMFSWIGIGIASFVTLGIFALIYIHARNKKLK
ncbi:MAG: hypothetical protein IJ970_00695 [Mycoplasmataceae bacterium]|nr:hypothetical protein [Mycoplasmataceae bacterium]